MTTTTNKDKVLAAIEQHGVVSPQGVATLTGIRRQHAWRILKGLVSDGVVVACKGAPGTYKLKIGVEGD